jgi:RimJ/RimL family protein N-acetyltransferase
MLDAVTYSAVETLRNGRAVHIRAFTPADRSDLLLAVGRTSPLSLYRRFFTIKRGFTAREREFFLNVDLVNHVALVASAKEAKQSAIVGGGRYVVVGPGRAELAFTVIDEYQGQGIGAALMHHLTVLARAAGLQEFIAEVLPENVSMLKVLSRCGLPIQKNCKSEVVHVVLQLH